MNTILIVDDDNRYRELISLFLTSEGMKVVCAADGKEAIRRFYETGPDLVLLDVMLPDMSGFEVCREIRKTSDIPILFLSAVHEEDYHIIGYRAGGDDYIEKPFKSSVLALKINRILQRTMKPQAPDNSVIETSGIRIDMNAFTCTINQKNVELTKKEFLLLYELIIHKGRILTREYLLSNLWDSDYDGETRVVDVLITKLRKKLREKGSLIKTVINVGYKLEDS